MRTAARRSLRCATISKEQCLCVIKCTRMQTNAVKSPTNSPKAQKLVYTVKEVAQMLAISQRAAYNLCNSTTEFRVLRAGGSIRIPKDSFDMWLYRAA